MIDGETTPKKSFLTFFLSEYAFYAQLPGNLKGKNNATGSRSGNYLNFVLLKVLGDESAKLLSIMWVLQNAELFPVYR